ncbi:ATPase, T2SS/T4P/T4SS family [Cytobacillus sp. FJAT-54145]|uniref:ATPase, T2SS/T4P/T4SS family n=1 Tax=Cytobacillus spartinae TaxID=3299023 RepID=A0ABW6KI49_9BACI
MNEILEKNQAEQKDKPFDVAQWLADESADRGVNKQLVSDYSYKKKKQFKDICKIVKNDLDSVIDVDSEKTTKNSEWLERQHQAIIGDPTAISYFLAEIEKVLRTKNITSNDYPNYFNSLAEAIFHEVWGLSVLAKWDKYPESEACCIRGTQLWIDLEGVFVCQKEQFESSSVVERIKRAFVIRKEDSVINRESPELEVEKEDGSRITMIQPPRSRENYIMLRRFTVNKYTLYDQAERGTIPFDDVPIYRAISRTMPNMIVAGRVRSAKSTFMTTLIGERQEKYVGAVLEKHFEVNLTKHFPDRLFFELQAKEGDLHKAIPRLLRMEHDYVVVGEIRSLEIEAYLISTERGERGALSTYHLTDVEQVVDQLARHALDEFPSRRFEVEVERIARNLDIIITMASDRDRRRKRVLGVTEVVWDNERKSHYTHDLIRYSKLHDRYFYSSKITPRLLTLMAEENLEETKNLIRLLREREKTSPMKLLDNSSYLEEVILGD